MRTKRNERMLHCQVLPRPPLTSSKVSGDVGPWSSAPAFLPSSSYSRPSRCTKHTKCRSTASSGFGGWGCPGHGGKKGGSYRVSPRPLVLASVGHFLAARTSARRLLPHPTHPRLALICRLLVRLGDVCRALHNLADLNAVLSLGLLEELVQVRALLWVLGEWYAVSEGQSTNVSGMWRRVAGTL